MKCLAAFPFLSLVVLMAFFLAGCSTQQSQRETPTLQYPAELAIVPREQWGWQPGDAALPLHDIAKITIHHGGEDFPPEKDPVKYLVGLQHWSRSEKHWVDIPYHYMIDLKGVLYETRPINIPGDTNTGYDVTGHALICVMGNYEHQVLSEAQLTSLVKLTALLAQHFNVPLTAIKGHKDYTETLCPGKDLYRYLQDGTLIARVQEQLNQRKESQP